MSYKSDEKGGARERAFIAPYFRPRQAGASDEKEEAAQVDDAFPVQTQHLRRRPSRGRQANNL
jgi:hypothetical protein